MDYPVQKIAYGKQHVYTWVGIEHNTQTAAVLSPLPGPSKKFYVWEIQMGETWLPTATHSLSFDLSTLKSPSSTNKVTGFIAKVLSKHMSR